MLPNQAAWVNKQILILLSTRLVVLICNLSISIGRGGLLQKFNSQGDCFPCFLTAPSTYLLYILLPRPSAAVGLRLFHLKCRVRDLAKRQHNTHHNGSQILAFKSANGQFHGPVHGCRNALSDQSVQVYGPAKELKGNRLWGFELTVRLQDKLCKDYEIPQIDRISLCELASQTHWNKADGQNLWIHEQMQYYNLHPDSHKKK